jgi:hypothetical protein
MAPKTIEIDSELLDLTKKMTVFEMLDRLGYNIDDFIVAHPKWMTSIRKAFSKATAEQKVVFALFTGPTWCPPCSLLEAEVIETSTFVKWADQNVVLLKLESTTPWVCDNAQHEKFRVKHNVSSWPTAIGFDPNGSERGRYGVYFKGDGPVTFLKAFETAAGMSQCSNGFCPMP